MLFVAEGFTFRNFLADAFAIFMFVVWFWLLITVFSDLFRRHDISGWVKAIWVIALIVFPYLGIFAYMITQARGMAERSGQQAQQAREELRRAAASATARPSRAATCACMRKMPSAPRSTITGRAAMNVDSQALWSGS